MTAIKLSAPQRRMLTNIRDGFDPRMDFDNPGGADRCYNALTRKGLVKDRELTPAGAAALTVVETAEAEALAARKQARAEFLANLTPEQIEARKAPVEQLLNRLKAMGVPGADVEGAKFRRTLPTDELRIAGPRTWAWAVVPHRRLGTRHPIRVLLAAPRLMGVREGDRDWAVEPYDGTSQPSPALIIEQEKNHG